MRDRDEVCHYINWKRGMSAKVAIACGVTRQNVYQWKRVPAIHVVTVAQILDITPNQIRPDIFRDTSGQGIENWPPLPHYISEPERWEAMQRDTVYGEDL
jgi:hypothetical protein